VPPWDHSNVDGAWVGGGSREVRSCITGGTRTLGGWSRHRACWRPGPLWRNMGWVKSEDHDFEGLPSACQGTRPPKNQAEPPPYHAGSVPTFAMSSPAPPARYGFISSSPRSPVTQRKECVCENFRGRLTRRPCIGPPKARGETRQAQHRAFEVPYNPLWINAFSALVGSVWHHRRPTGATGMSTGDGVFRSSGPLGSLVDMPSKRWKATPLVRPRLGDARRHILQTLERATVSLPKPCIQQPLVILCWKSRS
jgi:hypothetical protein